MASNFPLGRTQRDVFSGVLNQAQYEESGGSPRQSPIDGTAIGEETKRKEKRRCMGLKYLAFSIVVCGLLAGVIVAVVFGKKYLTDKRQKVPLGGIISTETPKGECPDVNIPHGDRIVFDCDFSQNHGIKAVWNDIDWNSTKVEYPPSHLNKPDMLCNKNDTGFVMRCSSDNVTQATCSNNGMITLKLKTRTGFEPYSTSFTMSLQEKKSITASTPIAKNASGSVVVRCSVSGVCKPYKMHFYAYETDIKKTKIDGPHLNYESYFNNTNGYTIACNDEIKGDDIRKGKTRVACALTDGMDELIAQETEIQFPVCCEKKVQSAINCEAVCRNCTGKCPYCNKDIWCRNGTNTFITDKDSAFDICEIMNNLNCTR